MTWPRNEPTGVCSRNPISVRVERDHWCGEYVFVFAPSAERTYVEYLNHTQTVIRLRKEALYLKKRNKALREQIKAIKKLR
jgi:hypothetical protein